VRHAILASALFVLCATSLDAQWLGTISIEGGYDDNMFRNYTAAGTASTDVTLMYGFFPDDRNWALNYTGNLTSFARYPERLYSTHSLGASWAMPYGENEAHSLAFMGIGSFRLDGKEYALYDYSQMQASALVRHRILDDVPLLASYRLRYRKYPNFGELGYIEHFATVGSMVFFESRTSVRLQAELGFKNYLRSVNHNSFPGGTGFTSPSVLTVDGLQGGGWGGGNGGWGGGGGAGRMDMGDRFGGGMDRSVEYLVYEEPSTSQLSTWINLGQGITESTGLSLRYLQRWNLTDRGRAFIGGAVDFIGEEELFDDPYSYESSELTLTLTQVLGWGMTLKAGGLYQHKSYGYPSTLDYSDPDVADRLDTRAGGWLTITKSLGGGWLLFDGLDLSLGYVYLRNQSNTSWYDYHSNAISLGISTDF
jgi:hypothetical protein